MSKNGESFERSVPRRPSSLANMKKKKKKNRQFFLLISSSCVGYAESIVTKDYARFSFYRFMYNHLSIVAFDKLPTMGKALPRVSHRIMLWLASTGAITRISRERASCRAAPRRAAHYKWSSGWCSRGSTTRPRRIFYISLLVIIMSALVYSFAGINGVRASS